MLSIGGNITMPILMSSEQGNQLSSEQGNQLPGEQGNQLPGEQGNHSSSEQGIHSSSEQGIHSTSEQGNQIIDKNFIIIVLRMFIYQSKGLNIVNNCVKQI